MFDLLKEFAEWLLDALLYVPRKVWEMLLDGLAGLIEAIPVPDFMQNLSSLFASMPSGVAYFASALQLGTGVTIILSALVIRFVIRRIPVIG